MSYILPVTQYETSPKTDYDESKSYDVPSEEELYKESGETGTRALFSLPPRKCPKGKIYDELKKKMSHKSYKKVQSLINSCLVWGFPLYQKHKDYCLFTYKICPRKFS